MKTYRVKNLYFEFIKGTRLDGLLTAEKAASILADHGLITLIQDKEKSYQSLTYYQWVKTEKINRHDFLTNIRNILFWGVDHETNMPTRL